MPGHNYKQVHKGLILLQKDNSYLDVGPGQYEPSRAPAIHSTKHAPRECFPKFLFDELFHGLLFFSTFFLETHILKSLFLTTIKYIYILVTALTYIFTIFIEILFFFYFFFLETKHKYQY